MVLYGNNSKRTRASGFERSRRLIAAAALALGAAGCVGAGGVTGELVYGYPAVRIESVPAKIYAYPRVPYGRGYAYLVDDEWYYDGPRGWVVFQSPPPELRERRVYIMRERRARPPARYYNERAPAYPREPVERDRRYYPE